LYPVRPTDKFELFNGDGEEPEWRAEAAPRSSKPFEVLPEVDPASAKPVVEPLIKLPSAMDHKGGVSRGYQIAINAAKKTVAQNNASSSRPSKSSKTVHDF
jgi:hypothetical protein